jgi:hypothetical protein
MSEEKPTTTATSSVSASTSSVSTSSAKYAWCVSDIQDNDVLPTKPPPITRMSTGAIIDGVFMTKDEMMHNTKEKKV